MPDRDAQLDAAEVAFARDVAAALTATADEFADALADVTELVAARFSVGRIARMWKARVTGLVRSLLGICEEAAQAAADDAGTDLPDGWEDLPGRHADGTLPEGIGRYATTTEDLLNAVGDRLADVTRRELAEGLDAGEDIDQLRARLRAAFARGGARLGPAREQRVAATEATRAWNTATLEAAKASTGPGRALVKQWLTRRDPRVRDTHAAVNGQLRLLDEDFIVAGVPMDAPGDPMAPAYLVVNCRCRLGIAPESRAAAGNTTHVVPVARASGSGEGRVLVSASASSITRRSLRPGPASQYHGTQGRPSYRKYHPKGGRRNGLTRHTNGGMLGSDRFSEEEHRRVLKEYTLAGYDDMNRWLRFRSNPEDVTVDEVQRHVSVLSDLISIQDASAAEKVRFRGMRQHVFDFQEGDEFHDKGFVSTSASEQHSRRMVGKKGGTFFWISVPQGAQMLDVSAVGMHDDEAEWILPPGTKYRVKKVGRLDDPHRPAVYYELEVTNA